MAVAIRTITRLQDADDAPALGVGQDGYALTWDNASGAFVATALSAGVTDHGALTGLSDDDHTGYALLAGRAGGQTLYGGTAANDDLTLEPTSNATKTTAYVLLAPSGGSVGVGDPAPDTTLHVDRNALTGLSDTAVYDVFKLSNTAAADNGNPKGSNVTFALSRWENPGNNYPRTRLDIKVTGLTTDSEATPTQVLSIRDDGRIGVNTTTPGKALDIAVTGNTNNLPMALGNTSVDSIVSRDVFLGYNATRISVGDMSWAAGNNGGAFSFVYLGARATLPSAGTEVARLTSDKFLGVGTTAPATVLHGLLTSAATNAVTNVVTIGHDTSGTAANGFGAGLLYQLESSTTNAQSAARIQALWNDATHATRKADLVLTAYDTAEREGLRIRGAGSAPAIGFLGATPAARIAHVADPSGGATVDAEARSAINSILATLETFGFHATS